jgi:hypothetical protein
LKQPDNPLASGGARRARERLLLLLAAAVVAGGVDVSAAGLADVGVDAALAQDLLERDDVL